MVEDENYTPRLKKKMVGGRRSIEKKYTIFICVSGKNIIIVRHEKFVNRMNRKPAPTLYINDFCGRR